MKRPMLLLSMLSMVLLAVHSAPVSEDYKDRFVCPKEAAILYKDCHGNLQECSICLGKAERECEYQGRQGTLTANCDVCTSMLNHRCDSAEFMCFSDAECNPVGGKAS
ncbi:hypothetical protein BGZ94_004191, partial [Podila epigama]